jgi:hypothetical protein
MGFVESININNKIISITKKVIAVAATSIVGIALLCNEASAEEEDPIKQMPSLEGFSFTEKQLAMFPFRKETEEERIAKEQEFIREQEEKKLDLLN